MSDKVRTWAVIGAKFLIAGGLIYWLVNSGKLDLKALRFALSPAFIVLCFAVLALQLSLNHFRWVLLARTRSFKIGYWATYPLTLMGIFFNFAMPGAVGGDLIKALYLGKDHGNRKGAAMTTIFMDRVIGLYIMLSMSLVALLFNMPLVWSKPAILNFFYILLALTLSGALMFALFLTDAYKKFPLFKNLESAHWPGASILFKLLHAFQDYRENKGVLLAAGSVAVVSQLLAVSFFGIVGYALGEVLSPAALIFAVSLGYIASAVPISPGGVGVGQVAFLYFFTAYTGQELQLGTLGITLNQVMFFCFGLLGLGYFLSRGKKEIELPA